MLVFLEWEDENILFLTNFLMYRVHSLLTQRISYVPLVLRLQGRAYSTAADTSKLHEWTKHPKLISWIEEQVRLCQPEKIHLCDGSEAEFNKYDHLNTLYFSNVHKYLPPQNLYEHHSSHSHTSIILSTHFLISPHSP